MSDFVPQSIELVGWSGDTSQLALRLGVSEVALPAALRRLGRKEGRRMVVAATPANVGPLLAAPATAESGLGESVTPIRWMPGRPAGATLPGADRRHRPRHRRRARRVGRRQSRYPRHDSRPSRRYPRRTGERGEHRGGGREVRLKPANGWLSPTATPVNPHDHDVALAGLDGWPRARRYMSVSLLC